MALNPADLGGEPSGSKARGKGLQHPTYANLIHDAISSLKQRGGSSAIAIRKNIEQKVGPTLGPNYKKIVGSTLSKLAKTGKLIKTDTRRLERRREEEDDEDDTGEREVELVCRPALPALVVVDADTRGEEEEEDAVADTPPGADLRLASWPHVADVARVADAEEEKAEAALLADDTEASPAAAPGESVTPPMFTSTVEARPVSPRDIEPQRCKRPHDPSIGLWRLHLRLQKWRTLRLEPHSEAL
ncbi:hypothetical protein R1sor_006049 [Riccia sorocarpa]|uniref:H15 domain-containing protein n=1 Tax=Riccia sorocarpa TaxID=122646 RepID=A0ABD3HLX7_9MARC